MARKLKVGVLASGSGTNLQAIIDRAADGRLDAEGVEVLALAGYMRIFTEVFVDAFAGRIMNIHPSLIPAFCGKGMHGLRVHQEAIAYGVKVSGLTVHFVETGVDTGP